jgi:hypothetical protein
MFVHLTTGSQLARIQRNGIARSRWAKRELPRGVYAVPVTRNFYISHQWLRELKHQNASRAIAAVYFRIPDDELVWVGHYNQVHHSMAAAEAAALFMAAENREGWEVIITRRVEAKEIHRTKPLPQVLGWRYYPEAKGKPPFCTCEYCTRGEYGARRLRARIGGTT